MKKIFYFLIGMLLVVSCDKKEVTGVQEIKELQYAESFENTFGKIASNQTWGFSNVTRGANVTGNLWYQNWERPVNVTDEEIEWAKQEFGKVRENTYNDVNITWENYWVQQVYTGQRGSVDGNGNIVYPSDVCNQLIAWGYKTNVINWYPYEWEYSSEGEYQHVNNFNNANNTTQYVDDKTKEKFIGTTLMENMKSDGRLAQFGYHNTSDASYHYDYIVIEHNGSYFIGFDIVGYHPIGQDSNVNMDVERDWIFDDWIVKISPAEPVIVTTEQQGRIICEDLGNIGDFDFNDVVFDAYIATDGTTTITLLAAGGTLDIAVAGVNVGEVMGKMINTGIGNTHVPYTFTASKKYTNLIDIPIIVSNKDAANNVISYELSAQIGKAPQKICVPLGFRWCKEYKRIDKAYPGFTNWVNNGDFWNGEVDESLIY